MARGRFVAKGTKGRTSKKVNGKYSNEYKLTELDFQEILGLNNKELISRTSSEYANWMATEKLKKEDTKLSAVNSQIKEMEDEIKQHDDYVKLKEKLDAKFEELADDELSSLKEEKKNLMEPYKEDIDRFKNCFKASMDEINRRKKEGKLIVEGKII